MRAGELSAIEIGRALLNRKWLIVSLTILGGAVAASASLIVPDRYAAEVVVSPMDNSVDSGSIGSLTSRLGNISQLLGGVAGTTNRAELIAALQSRRLAANFIELHRLAPDLFPTHWDPTTRTWRDPVHQPSSEALVYRFLNTVLEVSESKTTGLVTVAIESTDPALAAQWANNYVKVANDSARAAAIAESNRNLDYLRTQLSATEIVEIRQAISVLIESELRQATLANVRQEYAYRVIDPATPPTLRKSPNRTLFVAIGLAGGFAVAAAWILLAFAALSIKRGP